MTVAGAIRCVWLRYFAVFHKSLKYAIVTTFFEPLLYLFAFGFGLGPMIGTVDVLGVRMTYRQFIFAGIVAQTLMFQGFFEAAFGSFIRMYYQRVFQAIAVTQITLSEVLWAELIWDTSKATFAASAVLLIGVVTGDFSPAGALATLPIAFLSGLLFAALGLLVAAKSKTIEEPSLFFCIRRRAVQPEQCLAGLMTGMDLASFFAPETIFERGRKARTYLSGTSRRSRCSMTRTRSTCPFAGNRS